MPRSVLLYASGFVDDAVMVGTPDQGSAKKAHNQSDSPGAARGGAKCDAYDYHTCEVRTFLFYYWFELL